MTWTKIKTGAAAAAVVLLCVVTVPLGFHLAAVKESKRPSKLPGFRYFTNLSNVGCGSPEAALQTFHEALKNQTARPLNRTRMKELWNVTDDFDDPNARYSIDIGQGFGPEIGYRVANQERIASNEVRLVIDYEMPRGGWSRREDVFVEKDGRWRLQPVRVTNGNRK